MSVSLNLGNITLTSEVANSYWLIGCFSFVSPSNDKNFVMSKRVALPVKIKHLSFSWKEQTWRRAIFSKVRTFFKFSKVADYFDSILTFVQRQKEIEFMTCYFVQKMKRIVL